MKVGKIDRVVGGKHVTVSAKISDLPDGKSDTLWYKFPKELNQFIPDRHDPLFVAMLGVSLQKGGQPFIVKGSISECLLTSGTSISKAYFKNIPAQLSIGESKVLRNNFRSSATAMFFTSGVDSLVVLHKVVLHKIILAL